MDGVGVSAGFVLLMMACVMRGMIMTSDLDSNMCMLSRVRDRAQSCGCIYGRSWRSCRIWHSRCSRSGSCGYGRVVCGVCVCVFAGRVCGLSSLVDVWCVLAERVWPCGYVVCLLAEWLWLSGCAVPGLSQLYATLYSGTKSCLKTSFGAWWCSAEKHAKHG